MNSCVARMNSLESGKYHLKNEIDDLNATIQAIEGNVAVADKKQRQFERLAAEWKAKCEEKAAELEQSQKEARGLSSEAQAFRAELDEALALAGKRQLETKRLAAQLKDTNELLASKGVELNDSGLVVKKMVAEREELRAALDSADTKVQLTEARLASANHEVANGKQELERLLLDKSDEIKSLR